VADTLIPSPQQLASTLSVLLRTGVTTEGLLSAEAICTLPIVRAKAASDTPEDQAVAALGLIREAAVRVDGETHGAATILLGLAPGTRGSLLKDRRARAAAALFLSPEHLRKEREPVLIKAVADELYAADSAWRRRQQRRDGGERPPARSALGVDWLAQHRSYRRIWTPVSGMRNDVVILVRYLRAEEEDQPAIADRLCTITWHYTRFLLELAAFVEREGGLWLLSDPDQEVAAADAIYRIGLHVPLGESDDSWLRTLLLDAPHQELDGFSDVLIAAGERRRELMAAWVEWARACTADLGQPHPRCELHAWLAACDEFIGLIDEDWYRVADWYRARGNEVSLVDT
jgi:hypothetical protein